MTAYKTIEVQNLDGVLTLWLNRPDRLNAFTTDMGKELAQAIVAADGDDAVRAVVVAGRGRTFCAGMELVNDDPRLNVFGLDPSLTPSVDQLRENPEDPTLREYVRDSGGRLSLTMRACRKPIIGAIHGAAVGIGATMTLPMDARIAGPQARFGFVFGRIGIVPEALSSWYLPRIVGLPKALELVLTADIVDAEAAQDMGLVNEVVPEEMVHARAVELADAMTKGRSPVAVALARQMLHRNSGLADPYDAHLIESLAMFETARGDGVEGIAAFLDKRDPIFTSKVCQDMPAFYPWWTE